MEARDIPTLAELGVRLRKAGYRGAHESAVGQWMSGASRPQSVPRLCFYLDKALTLTDDEKAAVAAAVGRSEYPLPPQPAPKERRVFWSASSISHHGKLL